MFAVEFVKFPALELVVDLLAFFQQQHYQGLIEYVVETSGEENDNEDHENDNEDSLHVIPYGITGLVDKKTVLQCGEKVMN